MRDLPLDVTNHLIMVMQAFPMVGNGHEVKLIKAQMSCWRLEVNCGQLHGMEALESVNSLFRQHKFQYEKPYKLIRWLRDDWMVIPAYDPVDHVLSVAFYDQHWEPK